MAPAAPASTHCGGVTRNTPYGLLPQPLVGAFGPTPSSVIHIPGVCPPAGTGNEGQKHPTGVRGYWGGERISAAKGGIGACQAGEWVLGALGKLGALALGVYSGVIVGSGWAVGCWGHRDRGTASTDPQHSPSPRMRAAHTAPRWLRPLHAFALLHQWAGWGGTAPWSDLCYWSSGPGRYASSQWRGGTRTRERLGGAWWRRCAEAWRRNGARRGSPAQRPSTSPSSNTVSAGGGRGVVPCRAGFCCAKCRAVPGSAMLC